MRRILARSLSSERQKRVSGKLLGFGGVILAQGRCRMELMDSQALIQLTDIPEELAG